MKSINKMDIYRISSENSTYEIFKSSVLGTGSYSVVYMGRCISSKISNKIQRPDKLVAIKKINMVNIKNEGNIKMLMTEIKIMKELIEFSHPNIVRCYDVIQDIDVIYIVMEYCDGGDLSSLLIGKQFKNVYIRHYFGQIINAIKFLKEKKIIHRDMKPKNILLMENNKIIKLCDFGFAKQMDSLKRVTTICGSPLYMAPELYKKESYTESVDVWSLGIILFEMIFGIHPFAKHNDIESLSASVIKNDIYIGNSSEVTENCLNLLSLMLKKYESDRIKIEELFEHEWIKNECVLQEGELSDMFNSFPIHMQLYSTSLMSPDCSSNCSLKNSLNGSTINLGNECSQYMIFEIDD